MEFFNAYAIYTTLFIKRLPIGKILVSQFSISFFLFTIMYIFYKRKNRANDKSNAIQSKKEEISAIFP